MNEILYLFLLLLKDIKPRNILVPNNNLADIHLIDFGIAYHYYRMRRERGWEKQGGGLL